MTMKTDTFIGGLVALGALAGVSGASSALAQTFETPGFVETAGEVDASLLDGPFHTLDPLARSNGMLNTYVIRSQFGEFTVQGNDQLDERLHEIGAIAQLSQTGRSEVILDTVEEETVNLIRSPFRLVRRTAQIITSPDEARELVESVPQGVSNVADTAGRFVETGVEATGSAARGAGDAIIRSVDGESCDPERENCEALRETAQETSDAARGVGRRLTGQQRAKRDLQRELGVDPYSDNEILQSELDRVAWTQASASLGFRLVPNPYGQTVQLVSSGVSVYDNVERLALYEDAEVRREREAAEIAQWGGVSTQAVLAFQENAAFTPTSQTRFVAALQTIASLDARRQLFALTDTIQTRQEARTLVRITRYLAALDLDGQEYDGFYTSHSVPLLRTTGDRLILPVVADHVFWTEETAVGMGQFQASLDALGASHGEIHVSGKVSERFRDAADQRGLIILSEVGF
ncbi:hypothetical protein RMQ97_12575 [Maricaulis sp. D1M11]|uniref:hypothetical protein n=1 Tax=Maricaulis sp. D1M11 TaxID=3076117 RepID=UPI0039B51849